MSERGRYAPRGFLQTMKTSVAPEKGRVFNQAFLDLINTPEKRRQIQSASRRHGVSEHVIIVSMFQGMRTRENMNLYASPSVVARELRKRKERREAQREKKEEQRRKSVEAERAYQRESASTMPVPEQVHRNIVRMELDAFITANFGKKSATYFIERFLYGIPLKEIAKNHHLQKRSVLVLSNKVLKILKENENFRTLLAQVTG